MTIKSLRVSVADKQARRGESRPALSCVGNRPKAPQLAMPSPHSPSQNHLLATLLTAGFERLAAHLELVPMPLGAMLYEPGEQLKYAYFPTTAIVSLYYVTESGASAESAEVGNEGVVGVSLFMGGNTTSSSAVVQTAGHAYRLESRLLKQEFKRADLAQRLLLRYTQALMTQMTQTAACNRYHTVEQQLCRWLLLTIDRVSSNELVMTQELVANKLGVRRESITVAAAILQQAGYIHYRRGHIAVLERAALETRACECYAVIRRENRLLLSDVRNDQAVTVMHGNGARPYGGLRGVATRQSISASPLS